MPQPFILHAQIASFADDKVNLKSEHVKDYRDQVNRLRDNLTKHINEHPDYGLVKMLHSGSVMKGTALRTINDMDVAVYVKSAAAPTDEAALHLWLIEQLQKAYPNLQRDQFIPQSHCVTVSFRGSGLNVDVVPVLYDGGADDRGYLITKDTGDRVLTSIPLHLKFIRSRKDAQPHHFRQVVRLVKWWIKQRRAEDGNFRFKSFMAELLCAYLADEGLDMSDYPRALEEVFAYIVKSRLSQRISFADYYDKRKLPSASGAAIEIFDPVNPENNVASRYSSYDRDRIVEAAHDALDALGEAHYATTKGHAIDLWQTLFGPSFNA